MKILCIYAYMYICKCKYRYHIGFYVYDIKESLGLKLSRPRFQL